MDYQSFKTVTIENPEILDFFDIFNNKILENMTLVIHRKILRRLNGLSNSLENLIEQINSIQKNKKGFTITLKSFIERSIKKETLFNEGVIITKTSENLNTNNNYFLGNQANNANSPAKNNSNSNNNKPFVPTSASCRKESVNDFDTININEKNKNLHVNSNRPSNFEMINNKSSKVNEINSNHNNRDHNKNLTDDKVKLSFEHDNSISYNKEDSISTNKMFSVSRKLNVPFFPDNDEEEEDIDLSDEEQSEGDNSVTGTEKSEIHNKNIPTKKEINQYNKNNSFSDLKDENTKSNTFNNDASNNEGIKFDKKKLNERFSFKDNLRNGQTQNILVNNINNIHNINIVNNDIKNIQNLKNLSNFDLINKNTSLNLNAGLPPTYNLVKKSNLRSRDKEESMNGK